MGRGSGIGGVILVIWLIIGVIAAGQRGYFDSDDANCAKTGTIGDAQEAAADSGRVKQLETENQQLKQLIGNLSLEKKLLLDRVTELQKKA